MKKIIWSLIIAVSLLSIQEVKALQVGDYVKMTPTSTSYTISAADTGHDSDQTIDPSELNIWRIISKNADGTYDAVSQYVSSTRVYFKGQTGYAKLVGTLNTIANQYQNSTYTVGARHMGYNSDLTTKEITDTSALTSTTAPWTYNTYSYPDSYNEKKGFGDVGYLKDYNLVQEVIGTLKAIRVDKTYTEEYWLASREYKYSSSNYWYYYARYINGDGTLYGGNGSKWLYYYSDTNGFISTSYNRSIRPIITLRTNIITSGGKGTSSSPYTLAVTPNNNKYICKRATELHAETCKQTDSTYYCSGAGYVEGNKGTTITYGNLGTSGILKSGDAFDCDVNGDGIYNEATERFYYVSNYFNTETKKFDSDTAVLIYYNNTSKGIVNNVGGYGYAFNDRNYEGPLRAKEQLPTTSQWKNIRLINTARAILNETGGNTTSGGTLPTAYSYAGYAARLLTAQEVAAACNITVGSYTRGELDKCHYLLENTGFSASGLNYGYWLETPSSNGSSNVLYISPGTRIVSRSSYAYGQEALGVRPVIEIEMSKLQLVEENEENNSSSSNNSNASNSSNGASSVSNNQTNNSNSNNNINNNDNAASDNNKNETDNPQTGAYLPFIVISIGILLVGTIYYIVKRKNKIAKI